MASRLLYNCLHAMTNAAGSSSAWDRKLLRDPHSAPDKRGRVQRMFAAIAPSYDLNNRLHSLWMDQHWRRVGVRLAALRPGDQVVDVACGTGDLALRFARQLRVLATGSDTRRLPATCLPQPVVIGVDFTWEMLPLARAKSVPISVASADPDSDDAAFEANTWINGDAQALPLPDACADVVSIAFGIRNVADAGAAMREFRRILRPGGRLIILEFSLPTNRVLRSLYNFYFRRVLPVTATLISRDRSGAYRYLPESVNTFIDCQRMVDLMQQSGFTQVEQRPLTWGICIAYRGVAAQGANP
jgi:demethylmenaquinone methyltransferase/2-methoxy-6-polyprenyl-1,4-benzoquinol methylase